MKVEYGPELIAAATMWQTYGSTLTDTEGNTWPVVRCRQCDNAILEEGISGIAYHMITHHGFRMDGRHEREQALAAEAAAERGEMNAYHRP
jgi:hypothetical protein